MPDPRLIELTPRDNFRAKVAAVIADLEGLGFSPVIQLARLTTQQQRERWREGLTHRIRSGHEPGRDGFARAAWIKDSRWTYSTTPRIFWLRLGQATIARRLYWGGLYMLPFTVKRRLIRAINEQDWNLHIPLGWEEGLIEFER